MTMPGTAYSTEFYTQHQDWSLRSAEQIVPFVLRLVPARSVLDVGCGNGTWLKAMSDAGVTDLQGLDGDYVNRAALLIPPEKFMPMDVSRAQPLGRRFDLVMSLEVAEHLDAADADRFVSFLVQHGDVVLFSAACPNQGGTDHRNEQWPSYWAAKFKAYGFQAIDPIRWHFLNREVAFWYSQNTLIYANDAGLARFPELAALPSLEPEEVPALVHPGLLRLWVDQAERCLQESTLKQLLPRVPSAMARSLRHRWDRLFHG